MESRSLMTNKDIRDVLTDCLGEFAESLVGKLISWKTWESTEDCPTNIFQVKQDLLVILCTQLTIVELWQNHNGFNKPALFSWILLIIRTELSYIFLRRYTHTGHINCHPSCFHHLIT